MKEMKTIDMTAAARFTRKMALKAGKLTLHYRKRLDRLAVDFKGDKDIVTEADRAVEMLIRRMITRRFPEHAIVGEEEGATPGNDWCWSVDPIDGTVSFARGHDHFAVSIALKYRGETEIGVVYMPVLKELYLAVRGQGATMNGRPIGVSRRSRLDDAVMATGFACMRKEEGRNNLSRFAKALPELLSIRRYGSAAYDLVMVASGRIEGFWELNLNPWDVDAGILLVREAGGQVTDFSGGDKGIPGEIIATNGLCHKALSTLLNSVTD